MDHQEIEAKWQRKWEEAGIFKADDSSKKEKFYALEMFPYPSASAMHVGHARNYIIGDVLARFKRIQGFNVLYPMGWDSFGLPTEQAAIDKGIHPTESIKKSIEMMKEQLKALSITHDWSREISTHTPEYYKWTQWIFLQLFKKGLAYQKLAPGNWCEHCKTVLANDEVKDGKCWRCDTEVIQKDINQWFVKTTDYADRLLEGLDRIEWSERLKSLQRNWIGKSEGVEIVFDSDVGKIPVFTTRPDTLFGCTFIVLAPEHEIVKNIQGSNEVSEFLDKIGKMSELDRQTKEKEGIFTGYYAINPVNGEKVPIYTANFVLSGYGTGAIMSVPAHDERDREFAEKYGIEIRKVVENGNLTNSGEYDGMSSEKAKEKITEDLSKKDLAERKVNYKLRDWCVSRQRYWGVPIPMIHCEKCGTVPIPEKDLPVELPLNVDFSLGKGVSALAANEEFVNTSCPECSGAAKRETDTMTTFVDSSWYYLRYCDPKNNEKIFDKGKVNYWMPVDQYIGGIEHAVGHLLFSRFITKFLNDEGYLDFDEPFMKLMNQGMVQKGGVKMSKSKGNVVDPRTVTDKYGSDVMRVYLMFMAHPEKEFEWSDEGIAGVSRFMKRIVESFDKRDSEKKAYTDSMTQRTISSVTDSMERIEYNKVIKDLMELFDVIENHHSRESFNSFLKMLTPFAPYTCEEIWSRLGNKTLISTEKWPVADESKINEELENQERSLQKIIDDVNHIKKITGIETPKLIKLFIIPKDSYIREAKEFLGKEIGCDVQIEDVSKSNDPKAKKAKPGKPGINLE